MSSDILQVASAYNIREDAVTANLLFSANLPPISLTVKPGVRDAFTWVSGHFIDKPQPENRGPRWNAPGMIVGKCLGKDEVRSLRLFTGSSGQRLYQFLVEAGLNEFEKVYVTNLIKTQPLISGKWFQDWVNQQAFLLDMEIALIRPKFVLTLGKEATKHLTKNNQAISSIEGTWLDCELDLRTDKREPKTDENTHHYKVMPCTHPASLDYEQRQGVVERIQQVVKEFVTTLQAGKVTVRQKDSYPVIRSTVDLENLFDRIRQEHTSKLVAVDAEWQGAHPQNTGSWLRCVQLGWGPGKAATVSLTDTSGVPTLISPTGTTGRNVNLDALKRVEAFFDEGYRVAGHFFPADMEWLHYYKCDLSRAYAAASNWKKAKTEGGFALEAAVHAYDELSDMSLDSVTARFTDMPQYKNELFAHKKKQIELASKAKDKSLVAIRKGGYGWICDEVLYPYGASDVDATIRGVFKFIKLLDGDRFNNNCWLPYWRNHRASLIAAEIMREGLLVDQERLKELCDAYEIVYEEMRSKMAELIRWPSFSIDNYRHVLEFLYGRRYSAVVDKATGRRKSVRPCGALTINAEPVLNNEKSPKFWADVRARGKEAVESPGTSGKCISVMYNDPKGLAVRRMDKETRKFKVERIKPPESLLMIRELRTIRQVQKTFVGYNTRRTESGIVFNKGIGQTICSDGKVRCFISQVKETGRWSAKSPNLHAMPKRKEERYEKICGDRYPGGIRTIFVAEEGHLLIEADYSSAELFMLSIASSDEVLWDDCRRSLLPEDHPDYLDPHSNMAVQSLKLQCPPTKKGLVSIGKKAMRDVAKCVAAGQYLNVANGLVRVELLAEGLKPGEVRTFDSGVNVQSDRGETQFVAIKNTGTKKCVRVVTALGYELVCTPDHRWYVVTPENGIQFKAPEEFTLNEFAVLTPRLCQKELPPVLPIPLVKALKLFREPDSEHYDSTTPELSEAEVLGFVAGVLSGGTVVTEKQRALLHTACGHDQELAKRLLARLKHLGVGDEAIVVRTDRGYGVATSGIGLNAVIMAARKTNFVGIPELVMLWPKAERLAFLRGYAAAHTRGSAGSPTVVIKKVEEGKQFQMLLLASGIICRRVCLDHATLLSAVDRTSIAFFSLPFSIDAELPVNHTVSDCRLPYMDEYLRQFMLRVGLPTSHNDRKVYTRRRAIMEKLNVIHKIWDYLEPQQQEDIQRIHDLVFSLQITDRIVEVQSAGEQQTFDVETTEDRRHLVLFGGICTHNSVVYGWCYGRQPPAIVLQAAEEGVIIELSEAEAIFNGLASRYNRGQSYLRSAADCVQVGCLCTPLGRWRRFPESTDSSTLAGYEREAMNSPIQGGVADLVNDAAYNLYAIRQEEGMSFRVVLQVHDAFLFMVPYHEVVKVCNYVIPEAMVKRAPVVPHRLDGSLTSNEPKRLGFGLNIYKQWGESLGAADLLKYGIDSSKIERLE